MRKKKVDNKIIGFLKKVCLIFFLLLSCFIISSGPGRLYCKKSSSFSKVRFYYVEKYVKIGDNISRAINVLGEPISIYEGSNERIYTFLDSSNRAIVQEEFWIRTNNNGIIEEKIHNTEL